MGLLNQKVLSLCLLFVDILKIWMVDPDVVLQPIVIDSGGQKPTYLGPPESKKI